jgi:ParB-like chromosome segregation protein Spo0J
MADFRPEISLRQVAALVPYARNSRTHSDAQVAQIAASIREFGWTNPVLIDGADGIIAGHGRLLAARKLGLAEVPCIVLDHLSETQKRALIIADNKLALNAGWEASLLSVELRDLDDNDFDMTLTGFDERELANLLISENFEPGTEADQGRLDQLEPKMVICPTCQTEFDSREAAA